MHRQRLLLCLLILGAKPLFAQRPVPFGAGVSPGFYYRVEDLYVWDDKLVVGGNLGDLLGVPVGGGVASWDGSQVQTYGTAFGGAASRRARALVEYNDHLVAAGSDPTLHGVGWWDGAVWQPFDQGYPGPVNAAVVYNGDLMIAGAAGRVCRWNATTWDTLGTPFDGDVRTMAVYDGSLYAGGSFEMLENGAPLLYLARWNGTEWEQVLSGVNGSVYALEVTPQGLAIGGNLTATGDNSLPLPRWTFFNGTSFQVPGWAPFGRVNYIDALSNGSVVVRAQYDSSAVVNGEAVDRFTFASGPTAEYNGAIFMGVGLGDPIQSAESPMNQLVQLLPKGQPYVHVDAGALKGLVTPTPTLFHAGWSNTAGMNVPKDSATHALYAASPWLVGKQAGTWHGYLPFYGNAPGDTLHWAGPTANTYDTAFYHRYHQVWLVTQAMLNEHALLWQQPDYNMPEAIRSWPGNGNTNNGEAAQLAPFHDEDGNGIYEPLHGDHPLIRGDQAAYYMLHGGQDFNSGLPPMTFDMHVLAYAYEDPDEGIDKYNSVFVNVRVINRSGADMDSVRFGLFGDMDLGGFYDDLAECDSTRSLFYVYNGDDTDLDSDPVQGYGDQPPAAGFKFLNQAMTAHRAWDYAIDDEIVWLDAMHGRVDGAPFMELGYPTHFEYPGGAFSDSLNASALERRNLGSAGPFMWNANDTLCFDVVFTWARASSGGAYASVAPLKERADAVQAWYDAEGFACGLFENVVGMHEMDPAIALTAYPNPAGDQLMLTAATALNNADMLLFDAAGAQVQRTRWPAGGRTAILDLSMLSSGVYIVKVNSAHASYKVRFVRVD